MPFILRTNCMHASHQQTTATHWWHMRANCMHAIYGNKSKERDVLSYVSKLHTCKVSANSLLLCCCLTTCKHNVCNGTTQYKHLAGCDITHYVIWNHLVLCMFDSGTMESCLSFTIWEATEQCLPANGSTKVSNSLLVAWIFRIS